MIKSAVQRDYLVGEFISIDSSHKEPYDLIQIFGDCTNGRKISFERHILEYACPEKPLIMDICEVRKTDTTFYAELVHLLKQRAQNPKSREVYICGINSHHSHWLKILHCEKTLHELKARINKTRESAIEEILNQ